jgi:hypothetical protein
VGGASGAGVANTIAKKTRGKILAQQFTYKR